MLAVRNDMGCPESLRRRAPVVRSRSVGVCWITDFREVLVPDIERLPEGVKRHRDSFESRHAWPQGKSRCATAPVQGHREDENVRSSYHVSQMTSYMYAPMQDRPTSLGLTGSVCAKRVTVRLRPGFGASYQTLSQLSPPFL